MVPTLYAMPLTPAQSDEVPLIAPAEAGNGLVETVTVEEEVHPLRSPVTVYIVVKAGLTLTGEPDKLPGCQVQTVALPNPVKAEVAPEHTVDGKADADTFGKGFTVIVNPVETAPKPQVLFPLTVKVPLVALYAKLIVTAFPVPLMVAPVPL